MKKYQNFNQKFSFLVLKFSVYLNRLVFIMDRKKGAEGSVLQELCPCSSLNKLFVL